MRKSHRDQYKLQLQQTDTVFTCYKCDKSFSSSEELSQHQATHSREEKPFRCPYCRKNFFTFTELNKHRRHECIERRCPCRDCGALFPSPSRLRNHRMAMHPQHPVVADDINTYQCCKCGRGFQTEEELLQHQERFASELNCDVKPQGKNGAVNPRTPLKEGGLTARRSKKKREQRNAKYTMTRRDVPPMSYKQSSRFLVLKQIVTSYFLLLQPCGHTRGTGMGLHLLRLTHAQSVMRATLDLNSSKHTWPGLTALDTPALPVERALHERDS